MYSDLVAMNTLMKKEIRRFLRIWTQTVIPPAITMGLYFIIFGQFIGSQIGGIAGYTYMQYIVPGLLMMAIITNAFSNTAGSVFLTKFNKSIEEMLVSPMSNLAILLGFTLAGMLRGLLVGIVVTIIARFFTHIPVHHVGVILIMSIMSSLVFAIAGLINGIYAKNFDDIAFIPTFILTPLTYLGGVFYSIKQLPPIWQHISLFNPILHIVDSFRYGFLGVSDLPVHWGILWVVGLLLLLFVWALHLLNKGVGIKV